VQKIEDLHPSFNDPTEAAMLREHLNRVEIHARNQHVRDIIQAAIRESGGENGDGKLAENASWMIIKLFRKEETS
jgi:hypothetical protein